MLIHVLKRLAAAVPVALVIGVLVFLLVRLAPGDPAVVIAGEHATPEIIADIRLKLGLDAPLWIQFWQWAAAVLSGDLGTSLFSGLPVTRLIAQRLEPTMSLALVTVIFAAPLAIALGVLAAWRSGSVVDRAMMVFAVFGFSVPIFVVGYGLVYVGTPLGLPVQGYRPLGEGVGAWLRSLILPGIALSFPYVALVARVTRTSMLEVLSEDYVRTARAKGIAEGTILFRHALKNAAVPIATVLGTGVAILIGGVVIAESVFNIPGVGRLVFDAISKRDYPIIQGVMLFFSAVYVVVNLLVDISYSLFDPRIRQA